jgi:hypothetical protein
MQGSGRQRFTFALACVITVAWSVGFILDILFKTYDPPASLTPLMLAVAAWCFGSGIVQRKPHNGEGP